MFVLSISFTKVVVYKKVIKCKSSMAGPGVWLERKFEKKSSLARQVERMARFMDLEGMERSQEILEKAEEEYTLTKWSMVKREKQALAVYYEKKLAQMETNVSSEESRTLNASRIAVFNRKKEGVDSVVEEVQERLRDRLAEERLYAEVLEQLLLEGLTRLMAPAVVVRGRRRDEPVLRRVMQRAELRYQRMSGRGVAMRLDSAHLDQDGLGGVELLALGGRVKLDNTLQARVASVVYSATPLIRTMLFGPNLHRKFFD